MNKGTNWYHFIIQGALIVLSTAALVLMRHQLVRSVDNRSIAIFTGIVILIYLVCAIAFFIIGIAICRRNQLGGSTENLIKLCQQARIDALTELLNREEAKARIIKYLQTDGRRENYTLFMIDLDNFKSINDNFGHFEGDRVLKILASKIQTVFRTDDIVGRLGGDEFMVLMKHTSEETTVRKKASELLAALEYMTTGDDVSVTVTSSIGISICSGDRKDFETLYREADEALYRAKLAGKHMYSVFDNDETTANAAVQGNMALKESSAGIQLKALIDNIDGGIALIEVSDDIKTIYLSRSCINFMQLSDEAIKKADNRILTLLREEDARSIENTLRRGAESNTAVEAVFRTTGEDDRLKWFHMRAVRIPYEASDKPVLIAIFTDVTNLKETELKYEAQKKQLETVLNVSHIVTFEVDIHNHVLHMEDASLQKYGIPMHSIEDMPESVIRIGVIHSDSVDEIRRMYDEIYAGAQQGSAIVRTMKMDGQFTIERFTYFTVFDDQGYPVKAVGIAESLESFRNVQMRVDVIEKQFCHYSDNTIMTVKVMLRDDSFVSLKKDGELAGLKKDYQTYSDLLKDLMLYVSDPEDRTRLAAMFSLEGIQRYHAKGQDVLNVEYTALDSTGNQRYFDMSALTYVNPLDNEICVFLRIEDMARIKRLEELTGKKLERILGRAYSIDSIRAVTDALLSLKSRKKPCAVAILSITNFEAMKVKFGEILIKVLITGFLGKTKIVLHPNYVISSDGQSDITVLIPEIESSEWLYQLVDETISYLKKPAYFQFYEEDVMDLRCGVAMQQAGTDSFEQLHFQAKKALESIKESSDIRIGFYEQPDIIR